MGYPGSFFVFSTDVCHENKTILFFYKTLGRDKAVLIKLIQTLPVIINSERSTV
jgi:hypothetical protein